MIAVSAEDLGRRRVRFTKLQRSYAAGIRNHHLNDIER